MTREEAIKIIDCYDIGFYDLSGAKIHADKLADAFDMAIKALSPEVRPTGEWIQKDMYADRFCSECNYAVWDSEAEEYNFCPNCGARMNGGEEE